METSTCCRGPKVIPGEAIGMDIGTLPWSDSHGDNYRYFLLMVDLVTRYVELQPLRDQEANSILEAFEQGWTRLNKVHMNAIKNETSRPSPHILTYGREPRSPLDAWYDNLGNSETNSHEEYLQASKREELCGIAQENIDRNLVRVRDCYNLGKSGTDFNKGDKVMLKRNMVQDSLSAKYEGLFEVLERSGPDVKLQLAVKERWVHPNNVKKYVHVGQAQTVIGDAGGTQYITTRMRQLLILAV